MCIVIAMQTCIKFRVIQQSTVSATSLSLSLSCQSLTHSADSPAVCFRNATSLLPLLQGSYSFWKFKFHDFS